MGKNKKKKKSRRNKNNNKKTTNNNDNNNNNNNSNTIDGTTPTTSSSSSSSGSNAGGADERPTCSSGPVVSPPDQQEQQQHQQPRQTSSSSVTPSLQQGPGCHSSSQEEGGGAVDTNDNDGGGGGGGNDTTTNTGTCSVTPGVTDTAADAATTTTTTTTTATTTPEMTFPDSLPALPEEQAVVHHHGGGGAATNEDDDGDGDDDRLQKPEDEKKNSNDPGEENDEQQQSSLQRGMSLTPSEVAEILYQPSSSGVSESSNTTNTTTTITAASAVLQPESQQQQQLNINDKPHIVSRMVSQDLSNCAVDDDAIDEAASTAVAAAVGGSASVSRTTSTASITTDYNNSFAAALSSTIALQSTPSSRRSSPMATRPPLPTVTTTTSSSSSQQSSPTNHQSSLQQQHNRGTVSAVNSSGNLSVKSVSSKPQPPSSNKSSGKIPHIPAAATHLSGTDDDGVELVNADRIRLGICAMDKKARSKPMAEILSRLDENLFQVVFFGDEMILNQPIEEWPVCDVLIAFFSKGYPLPKAEKYVALRKPFILNDIEMQALLQDRRRVYDLLEASGIDVPRHAYLSRDGYVSTGTGDGNGNRDTEVTETDDAIEINGIVIHKPFVEKPVDAEDHNIAIYYPTSAGGGCKKLFRKIGNRSSEFYPGINEVRRDGSYIYEEFVETQGTDVKMYTVGPEYGHAEARKSPTVDGKVERNSDGKEVRFPVILNYREKEIARRIVLVFKQFVCGFDILRVQEGHGVVSMVCDVNGWSFVKNSRKYYDDCSQILSEHIIALVKPGALTTFSTLDPLMTTSLNRLDEEIPEDTASITSLQQQRSRGNKVQHERKDTLLTRAARMLGAEPNDTPDDDLLHQHLADSGDSNLTPRGGEQQASLDAVAGTSGSPSRPENTVEVLKSAAITLREGALPVRSLPNQLTSQPASLIHSDASSLCDDRDKEAPKHGHHHGSNYYHNNSYTGIGGSTPSRTGSIQGSHQEELRCLLAIVRHGDRTPKQKLKVNMTEPHILKFFHNHSKDPHKDLKVKAKAPMTEFLRTVKTTLEELEKGSDTDNLRHQLMHMRDILERWKIVGLNRKLQIKPRKFEDYTDPETGEAKQRCIEVQLILKWGGNLTKLGEKQAIALGRRFRHEMYPDASGGGILRLHSTFRHDLKIKTSDEGRVMKTAAAFAKGLLELEGDLPPILVSLVHKEKGSMHMLDPSGNKEVKQELDECKERITANLQRDIASPQASEEELEQLVGPKQLTALREALINRVGNPRKALQEIHQTMGKLIGQLEEMLDAMGSGDEKRIEGGEGLRGETDDDVALSGVKLYKGETLLELTERWKFIYDRLYDSETDKFDLSRIPDVHDNVRFDVLHNPHLGLSATLHKLYSQAQGMADCVVPQEYGTTIEEKRTIGGKICSGLLEKISYDLGVARTDNNTDMRYLINMDYSFDLNINTMGRRIRTRMYFTSESHLHTVLNVLRFAKCEDGTKSLLSEHGMSILNATPELCYLTQIVMRVFEDSRRDFNDPRRFRVELLFSPGATATPFHMDELARQSDSSRFDTAPLQRISRDDVTCEDVEKFFESAIMAGRSSDEESHDVASTSTPSELFNNKTNSKLYNDASNNGTAGSAGASLTRTISEKSTTGAAKNDKNLLMKSEATKEQQKEQKQQPTKVVPNCPLATNEQPPKNKLQPSCSPPPASEERLNTDVNETPRDLPHGDNDDSGKRDEDTNYNCGNDNNDKQQQDDDDDDDDAAKIRKIVARKYFWGTVAVGSFALGVGFLLMALRLSDDRARQRRRWSTRRY